MPLIYFSVTLGWNVAGSGEINAALFQPVSVIAAVVGPVIAFVLPGAGLLAFLILTEKDRRKPWAKAFTEKTIQREMEMWTDPATASRFGMFSGAIWILAAGLFVLLGFLIGFKFSWLVFIFAVGIQLLIQGGMYKKVSSEQ
jgi:hypothetical protein